MTTDGATADRRERREGWRDGVGEKRQGKGSERWSENNRKPQKTGSGGGGEVGGGATRQRRIDGDRAEA